MFYCFYLLFKEMIPKSVRKVSEAFPQQKYFGGEVTIKTKKMFKEKKPNVGQLNLEILSMDAFDKEGFSEPVIKSMLEDFTVVSQDGTRFPCHKMFLAGEHHHKPYTF